MTRINLRGLGGLGLYRDRLAETGFFDAYIPADDNAAKTHWILNCGDHGGGTTTCPLQQGRVVKKITPIAKYNKSWQFVSHNVDAHTVTTKGNGELLIEYEPLAPTVAYADYDAAARKLETLNSRIIYGGDCSDYDAGELAIPQDLRLPPAPSDAPEGVLESYSRYKFLLEEAIPEALNVRAEDCAIIVVTPPSPIDGTGGDTDTNGGDGGWGGGSSTSEGGSPYDQGSGAQSYAPDPNPWNIRGGGTVIGNPFGPPPVSDVIEQPRRGGAGIAIGGAVVLGLGMFLLAKRKRRRSRAGATV